MTEQPITVPEMCAALPQVFALGAKLGAPSQTIEQWEKAQA